MANLVMTVNEILKTTAKGALAVATFVVLFGMSLTAGSTAELNNGFAFADDSNAAPSLIGVNDVTLSVCEDGFNPMSGVSATDPDGDFVTISVSGDGAISGALSNRTAGTYALTYTADDGRGGFDIVDRTVTITEEDCGDDNAAPSLSGIDNITLSVCEDSFNPMSGVSASDPDGDEILITVAGDSILIQALTNNTAGTYTLTYTASDGRGGFDIVDRTISVVDANCDGGNGGDNAAPSLTGVNDVTLSVCVNSFDALSGVSATDPDNDPVQIDVDGDSVLNQALQNDVPGTYTLTYTAADGRGGFDIVDRTVTVINADCGGNGGSSNTAPSLTGVNNLTLTVCQNSFDPLAGVSATDPDGDPVQIDVDGDSILIQALTNNTVGTYTLTYTASDGRGGFDIVDRTVTVINADCGGNGGDDDGDSVGGGRARRYVRDRNVVEEVEEEEIILGECSYLEDFLRIDFNNDPFEVMKLQAFLRVFEGFNTVEINGIFDKATFQAVNAFQERYASEVLIPWGYAYNEPTGYVYITTKAKVNEIFCNKVLSFSDSELTEMAEFRTLLAQLKSSNSLKDTTYVSGVRTAYAGDDTKVTVVVEQDSVDAVATSTDIEITEPTVDMDIDSNGLKGQKGHSGIQQIAASIYSGLDDIIRPTMDFIFSTCFILFLLGIFLGWLLYEWYKGHSERKGQK